MPASGLIPVKKALFHVLGISMSLISGLLAAEIILRVRDEHGLRGAWDSLFDRPLPVSVGTATSEIVADPILGFKYNPALPGVNSLGIRDKEIAIAPPRGQKRIIVIGDSVSIMCDWKYSPRKGYVPFLRERFAEGSEVINAAISGCTTYQERVLLEHYLLPHTPDFVILQYTLNDNERFLHRFDSSMGLLLTEEARRTYLPERGDPLGWLPNWSYLVIRLRFARLQFRAQSTRFVWENHPGFALAWRDDGWDLFEEQLIAIKSSLNNIGAQMQVLMVPFGPQFRNELLNMDRSYVLKPQSKMAELCRKHQVPLIDMFPVFEQNGGESLYYDMVHLTEKGHRVLADHLFERICSKPNRSPLCPPEH